jgi:RNA polymerase sigma-70 factor (ECF subfamily)
LRSPLRAAFETFSPRETLTETMMKGLAIETTRQVGLLGATPATVRNSASDLIARTRAGDEDAFHLIFDRYSRPVISFIYDMLNDRGLAEELMQETFVRAYKNLGALRDDAKLSTWLFGIAKNVAREAIRARVQSARKVELDDEAVGELRDEKLAPDDSLINKELSRVIQDALARLDEDKRTVFALKVFQQQSYEEIAAITGFSIAKLKTDLHRARMEMRRLIRPYLEVRS